MRIISILAFAAIVAGCAKSESPPVADTGMAMQPADAPPAAMSLTDVTGRWNIRVMGETSDSTLTTYVLDATADTSKWTFSFPKGRPIPMHIVNVGVTASSRMRAPSPASCGAAFRSGHTSSGGCRMVSSTDGRPPVTRRAAQIPWLSSGRRVREPSRRIGFSRITGIAPRVIREEPF